MKYFLTILKHKWYVFLAGRMTGAPLWNLLIHDWTKFLPCEFFAYNNRFYKAGIVDMDSWKVAHLHHINTNKHHWEYWVIRTSKGSPLYTDTSGIIPLEMPEEYVREMIADWMGASRAYEGYWPNYLDWKWWHDNKNKIILHKKTRMLVESIIKDLATKYCWDKDRFASKKGL